MGTPLGPLANLAKFDNNTSSMPTALIISPDPETRRLIALGLELRGHETTQAVDVEEMAHSDRPVDCVLLDMVDASSWNEARALSRAAREAGDPFTVLLLPRGFQEGHPRGPAAPFHCIVRKPFELMQLIRRIAEGMEEHRARAKHRAPKRKTPSKKKTTSRSAPAKKKTTRKRTPAPKRSTKKKSTTKKKKTTARKTKRAPAKKAQTKRSRRQRVATKRRSR